MLPRCAALLLLAVLTGCGGGGAPTQGGGPAAPSGPMAVLQPAEGTQVARRVGVAVAGAPAGVTAVQLRGGGFVQADPLPLAAPSPAGDLVAEAAYGPVLCEGRAAPVVVLLTTPGGVVEVPVPADDLLAGLRAAECAAG